jgi:hypothetical protein
MGRNEAWCTPCMDVQYMARHKPMADSHLPGNGISWTRARLAGLERTKLFGLSGSAVVASKTGLPRRWLCEGTGTSRP